MEIGGVPVVSTVQVAFYSSKDAVPVVNGAGSTLYLSEEVIHVLENPRLKLEEAEIAILSDFLDGKFSDSPRHLWCKAGFICYRLMFLCGWLVSDEREFFRKAFLEDLLVCEDCIRCYYYYKRMFMAKMCESEEFDLHSVEDLEVLLQTYDLERALEKLKSSPKLASSVLKESFLNFKLWTDPKLNSILTSLLENSISTVPSSWYVFPHTLLVDTAQNAEIVGSPMPGIYFLCVNPNLLIRQWAHAIINNFQRDLFSKEPKSRVEANGILLLEVLLYCGEVVKNDQFEENSLVDQHRVLFKKKEFWNGFAFLLKSSSPKILDMFLSRSEYFLKAVITRIQDLYSGKSSDAILRQLLLALNSCLSSASLQIWRHSNATPLSLLQDMYQVLLKNTGSLIVLKLCLQNSLLILKSVDVSSISEEEEMLFLKFFLRILVEDACGNKLGLPVLIKYHALSALLEIIQNYLHKSKMKFLLITEFLWAETLVGLLLSTEAQSELSGIPEKFQELKSLSIQLILRFLVRDTLILSHMCSDSIGMNQITIQNSSTQSLLTVNDNVSPAHFKTSCLWELIFCKAEIESVPFVIHVAIFEIQGQLSPFGPNCFISESKGIDEAKKQTFEKCFTEYRAYFESYIKRLSQCGSHFLRTIFVKQGLLKYLFSCLLDQFEIQPLLDIIVDKILGIDLIGLTSIQKLISIISDNPNVFLHSVHSSIDLICNVSNPEIISSYVLKLLHWSVELLFTPLNGDRKIKLASLVDEERLEKYWFFVRTIFTHKPDQTDHSSLSLNQKPEIVYPLSRVLIEFIPLIKRNANYYNCSECASMLRDFVYLFEIEILKSVRPALTSYCITFMAEMFSYGQDFYKRVFRSLSDSSTVTVLNSILESAHPSTDTEKKLIEFQRSIQKPKTNSSNLSEKVVFKSDDIANSNLVTSKLAKLRQSEKSKISEKRSSLITDKFSLHQRSLSAFVGNEPIRENVSSATVNRVSDFQSKSDTNPSMSRTQEQEIRSVMEMARLEILRPEMGFPPTTISEQLPGNENFLPMGFRERLYDSILSWNPNSLVEVYEKIKPRLVSPSEEMSSLDEYQNSFYPLLLEECRASVEMSLEEIVSKCGSKENSDGLLVGKIVGQSDDKIFRLLNITHNGSVSDTHDSKNKKLLGIEEERSYGSWIGCDDLLIITICNNDLELSWKNSINSIRQGYGCFGVVVKDSGPLGKTLCVQCLLENIEKLWKNAPKLPQSDYQITIHRVISLTTARREYNALCALGDFQLLNEILGKSVPKVQDIENNAVSWNEDLSLNQSQQTAVSVCVKRAPKGFTLYTMTSFSFFKSCCLLISRLCFRIQGPPGTGKTKTIVAIVKGLLETAKILNSSEEENSVFGWRGRRKAEKQRRERSHILLCAPSNAAVDELTIRLASKFPQRTKEGELFFLRVGSGINKSSVAYEYSLDALMEVERQKLEQGDGEEVGSSEITDSQLANIQGDIVRLQNSLKGNVPALMKKEIRQKIKDLESQKSTLANSGTLKRTNGATRAQSTEILNKIRSKFLNECQIICCTLSTSGSEAIRLLSHGFESVIIDESCQSVELSTLIPLQYNCKRCILVGDPQQLPATILSRYIANLYGRSLFERLQPRCRDFVLLRTQYRMHPEIRKFPSKCFYQDELLDGFPTADRRFNLPFSDILLKHYAFFDMKHSKEVQNGARLSNPMEADLVLEIIQKIAGYIENFRRECSIGIISPYQEQVKLINSVLREKGLRRRLRITVNTIDSFQGQEKDIILLSLVRAHKGSSEQGGSSKIGFLSDTRRLNVALTRAKMALYIIGCSSVLSSNSVYRQLIEDSKERSCYVQVSTSPREFFKRNAIGNSSEVQRSSRDSVDSAAEKMSKRRYPLESYSNEAHAKDTEDRLEAPHQHKKKHRNVNWSRDHGRENFSREIPERDRPPRHRYGDGHYRSRDWKDDPRYSSRSSSSYRDERKTQRR